MERGCVRRTAAAAASNSQKIEIFAATGASRTVALLHAMIEGGLDRRIQFKLVQSHLEAVYVKDFFWDKSEVKEVPLGEGVVDRKFFPMLRDTGYAGPICLHVEYLEGRKNQDALKTPSAKTSPP